MSKVTSFHNRSKDGNPYGGKYMGIGFEINWQTGVVEDGQQNGAFPTDILEAVKSRLAHFQTTKFACEENAQAIANIESAINCLESRLLRRKTAGVENTHLEDPQ